MSGKTRTWVAAVAVAAIVAGCRVAVDGSAVPAPAPPNRGGVDVALLDPGNYPRKPRPPLGQAGPDGALVEAHRMADNVTGPWEVDATLLAQNPMTTGVLRNTAAVNTTLGDPIGKTAEAHNYVTGFASARSTVAGPPKTLENYVLRFASDADAAAAAADMAANSTTITPIFANHPVSTHPVQIPRYEGSLAVSFPGPADSFDVLAFTAHGPYVLCQQANSHESVDIATQLVATTLDLQQPLIDRFQPTAPDQLAALPVDPSGLLARTVANAPQDATVNDGVYGLHGALHFQDDPARSQALFDAVGLQQVAEGAVNVYQTRDAASAARIVDSFAQEEAAKLHPGAGIKGMPAAKCLAPTKNSAAMQAFYCVAAADRYAIEATSQHELDAHQLVSAEYLMLTGK